MATINLGGLRNVSWCDTRKTRKKLAEVYKMSVFTNVNPTFRLSAASIKKKNTYRELIKKKKKL